MSIHQFFENDDIEISINGSTLLVPKEPWTAKVNDHSDYIVPKDVCPLCIVYNVCTNDGPTSLGELFFMLKYYREDISKKLMTNIITKDVARLIKTLFTGEVGTYNTINMKKFAECLSMNNQEFVVGTYPHCDLIEKNGKIIMKYSMSFNNKYYHGMALYLRDILTTKQLIIASLRYSKVEIIDCDISVDISWPEFEEFINKIKESLPSGASIIRDSISGDDLSGSDDEEDVD